MQSQDEPGGLDTITRAALLEWAAHHAGVLLRRTEAGDAAAFGELWALEYLNGHLPRLLASLLARPAPAERPAD